MSRPIPSWSDVADAWEFCDGALMDIYVQQTNSEDWRKVLAYFDEVANGRTFTLGSEPLTLNRPTSFEDANRLMDEFGTRICTSYFLDRIHFNCHFFSAAQIEFDIDPREIGSQADYEVLINVLQGLSNAVEKPVLLTPENMEDSPILTIEPSGSSR